MTSQQFIYLTQKHRHEKEPTAHCALVIPAGIRIKNKGANHFITKGLTTAVFPTQYGIVKVNLPDDIRPGDMISGTVVAESKGNNAKQI